jgi:hypothetical protein
VDEASVRAAIARLVEPDGSVSFGRQASEVQKGAAHMVHTEPQPTSAVTTTKAMYLILYPKEMEEEVVEALESVGVPGYTELPKMIGRGRRVRHFDNPVWPGATGALFSVLAPDEANQKLVPVFKELSSTLEARSHGLYGLHMFALPCEQLI